MALQLDFASGLGEKLQGELSQLSPGQWDPGLVGIGCWGDQLPPPNAFTPATLSRQPG